MDRIHTLLWKKPVDIGNDLAETEPAKGNQNITKEKETMVNQNAIE